MMKLFKGVHNPEAPPWKQFADIFKGPSAYAHLRPTLHRKSLRVARTHS